MAAMPDHQTVSISATIVGSDGVQVALGEISVRTTAIEMPSEPGAEAQYLIELTRLDLISGLAGIIQQLTEGINP